MVSYQNFREWLLEFNGVTEAPHFDRIAFKTKRIFVTYQASSHTANFKFTIDEQAQFCQLAPEIIYPVPNKFGLYGWTTLNLNSLEKDIIVAAIELAYLGSK